MNIYTKNGDGGMTSLVHGPSIPKSDDRIELLGTLDELISHLGLVKADLSPGREKTLLEAIQKDLLAVVALTEDPHNRKNRLEEGAVEKLEAEIDAIRETLPAGKEEALPGGNRLSARVSIARSVARRAERRLSTVSIKFGSDAMAKKYMNRLGDYLYVLARSMEAEEIELPEEKPVLKPQKETEMTEKNNALIEEILRRVSDNRKINLETAKKLTEKIEEEARRRGKQAVIAVCGPEGNPISVHVMDGAFLVSFDVAMKKAYTSVAVKMSTKELSVLAQPGGTFYGVDKMDGGKIVIFGGGIPLKVDGRIIGGLGISGGTGEEDHSLAEYGLSVLPEIL